MATYSDGDEVKVTGGKTRFSITLFLKGVLMGACDIIPGVSGGTIAFITGIYERLINSVKSFSPRLAGFFLSWLFKRDKQSYGLLKAEVERLDLVFLINLFAGVGGAIVLGSYVMGFLLDNYPSFTLSFFIGLILASSLFIRRHITDHGFANQLFGLMGFTIGVSLAFLVPLTVDASLPYIFLGGFLAISAMFLPGVSGSFVLLVMGIYEFMIDEVLHNLAASLDYFFVFAAGAVLGVIVISRVISFLFRVSKCRTLYFLLGLVLGALAVPVRNILHSGIEFSFINLTVMAVLFLVGSGSVYVVHKKTVGM